MKTDTAAVKEIWKELGVMFNDDEHEWVKQDRRGLYVPYIRKPAIIHRLNTVIGPGNYSLTTEVLSSKKEGDYYQVAYRGNIEIYIGDRTIKFSDTGAADSKNFTTAEKGASTDAIKRVVKLIGIGLYLDTGQLGMWLDDGDVMPLIRMLPGKEKAVTLHPSLKFPLGANQGKELRSASKEALEAFNKWLHADNDSRLEDEYLFRLAETIKEFGMLGE